MHPAHIRFSELTLILLYFLADLAHIWAANQVMLHSDPAAKRFNWPFLASLSKYVYKNAQKSACIIHLLRRFLNSCDLIQSLNCNIGVRPVKSLTVHYHGLIISFKLLHNLFILFPNRNKNNRITLLAHQFTNSW